MNSAIHNTETKATATATATAKNSAQESSKPMVEGKKATKKDEIQTTALKNAVTGQSLTNYKAIFEGFADMGIDPAEIVPRENVFTFNAWKALGRVVKKGQHGVKVFTFIECDKKQDEAGEFPKIPVKKCKQTTVFHISQTELLTVGAA